MATVVFERIAPVIAVHDLNAALARYERLGFASELDGQAQYGFVQRGSVQLHLTPADPDDPDSTGGVVYIYVSDADALHGEWTSAGVDGRFLGPHDTPYGLREFVYTDPDGTVHRVGSPISR
jgi:hypothetical protein